MRDKQPSSSPPTIYTIAEKVGMSPATVSRALNGMPKVSEKNRQKIIRVAQELGFQGPNRHAQALRTNRSQLVGLLALDFVNPYTVELIGEIDKALRHHDYSHVMIGHNLSWQDIDHVPTMLLQSGVDAVITTIPLLESSRRQLPMPTVYISDRPEPYYDASLVINIGQGTKKAVRQLVELGHRDIAFLCIQRDDVRARSYKEAMQKAGLQPNFWDYQGPYYYRTELQQSIRGLVKEKLGQQPQPTTAIITHDDLMALTVFQVADELGIAVPKDLSVIGHDDTYISRLATPPLTTVAIPLAEIGRRAAQLAIELSGGTTASSPKSNNDEQAFEPPIVDTFDVTLITRRSTAPAPLPHNLSH